MDGAEVGIFKERDEVRLDGLLQSTDGRRLESEIRLEVLSDFTDQALKGQLPDQELGRLLVATDFSQGDGAGLVSVGLLDTTGRRSRLTSGLGCELLTRGLATGRFAWKDESAPVGFVVRDDPPSTTTTMMYSSENIEYLRAVCFVRAIATILFHLREGLMMDDGRVRIVKAGCNFWLYRDGGKREEQEAKKLGGGRGIYTERECGRSAG